MDLWSGKAAGWKTDTRDVPQDSDLLTPAEVAALFRVNPKTVLRWAETGKLSSVRTLGGHRRYHRGEVRRFLVQQAG
jgi:excisionase family DNA binding protein